MGINMKYLRSDYKKIDNRKYIFDRTYMPAEQIKAFKLDITPSAGKQTTRDAK